MRFFCLLAWFLTIASPLASGDETPLLASLRYTTGHVGTPFSYRIATVNEVAEISVAGLPSWATLGEDRWITGMPDAPGVHNLTITGRNGDATRSLAVMLEVRPPLSGPMRSPYPYVAVPVNRSWEVLAGRFQEWKHTQLISETTPDPKTMHRVGNGSFTTSEFQGYGMLLAAYLDADDRLLERLWNFAWAMSVPERHNLMGWHTRSGELIGQAPAPDGTVDIAMALDHAARRWPDSAWPERADHYARELTAYHVGSSGVLGGSLGRTGIYLNYHPMAYIERFYERSRDERYFTLRDSGYRLLEYSWQNLFLPGWYVDAQTGVPREPNDPWDSGANRWDAGPTRTAWRIPQQYFWTGDLRAYQWARRIYEVYASNGKFLDHGYQRLGTSWNPESGRQRNGHPADSLIAGGAAIVSMVVGDTARAEAGWDYLANLPFAGETLRDSLHVIYLMTLSGIFDLSLDTPPDPLWDIRPLLGERRGWVDSFLGPVHYDAASWPWSFSSRYGWLYSAGTDRDGVAIYRLDQGWIWTGAALYPAYFDFPTQSWKTFSP